MQANYPRLEIRKHMGCVADKHFQTNYEERDNFDVFNKCQLMEQQMRNELIYINKLSNMTFGRNATPEHKTNLSTLLIDISTAKKSDVTIKKLQSNETTDTKRNRYKNKNSIAYPGVNENVLKDMVTIVKPLECTQRIDSCNPKKKQKLKKKCKSFFFFKFLIMHLKKLYLMVKYYYFSGKRFGNRNNTLDTSALKKEPGTSSMSKEEILDVNLNSDCSTIDSDELTDTDDPYGDIVWRMLKNFDNINE